MNGHEQLIQWALVAIGIGQGILLFMFSLVWSRQREITKELREEIGTIWDSVRKHHEDTHAHGNGMPRGETLARIAAVEKEMAALDNEARSWIRENREDHKSITQRLDQIMDLLVGRRNG